MVNLRVDAAVVNDLPAHWAWEGGVMWWTRQIVELAAIGLQPPFPVPRGRANQRVARADLPLRIARGSAEAQEIIYGEIDLEEIREARQILPGIIK